MVSDIGLSSGVTGQDGKTTLTGLNGTDFWCVKEGYAKGFGRKTTLFKGAQLSGRVTDPEGKPAAGLPIDHDSLSRHRCFEPPPAGAAYD